MTKEEYQKELKKLYEAAVKDGQLGLAVDILERMKREDRPPLSAAESLTDKLRFNNGECSPPLEPQDAPLR